MNNLWQNLRWPHLSYTLELIIENCKDSALALELFPLYKKQRKDFMARFGNSFLKRVSNITRIKDEISYKISFEVLFNEFSELEYEQYESRKFYKDLETRHSRKYTPYEAIQDFKEELGYICWQKIKKGEDAERFEELKKKCGRKENLNIEKAKRIPLGELLGQLGQSIKRNHAQCLLCESKSKWTFHIRNNLFYCFRCNKGGDTIRFIQEYKKFSFVESVKYLQDSI